MRLSIHVGNRFGRHEKIQTWQKTYLKKPASYFQAPSRADTSSDKWSIVVFAHSHGYVPPFVAGRPPFHRDEFDTTQTKGGKAKGKLIGTYDFGVRNFWESSLRRTMARRRFWFRSSSRTNSTLGRRQSRTFPLLRRQRNMRKFIGFVSRRLVHGNLSSSRRDDLHRKIMGLIK